MRQSHSLPGTPLRVQLQPSQRLAWFIHLLFGGASLFICFQPLPVWSIAVILSLLMGSWLYGWRWHIRGMGRGGIAALEFHEEGGWVLVAANGDSTPVKLLTGSFVSNWLVVLNFRLNRLRVRSIILLPDNTDADELRRLRVRLGDFGHGE